MKSRSLRLRCHCPGVVRLVQGFLRLSRSLQHMSSWRALLLGFWISFPLATCLHPNHKLSAAHSVCDTKRDHHKVTPRTKPSFHRNSLQHQPKALSKVFLKKYTHKNSNPGMTEDHLAYLEFFQEVFLVTFWLYM